MKAWKKCHFLVHKRVPKEELRTALQKSHARGRYEERFGQELTHEEYADAVAQIQNNKGWFLEKQSNRVTVWCVMVNGEDAVAIYDKKTYQVRTFYTLEMWESKVPTH